MMIRAAFRRRTGRRLARPFRYAVTRPHEHDPMGPHVIRSGPLNVLVVLAEVGPGSTAMVSAFRSHTALICVGARPALDVAPQFEPDVIIIDRRIPDSGWLVEELARLSGGRAVFVALDAPAVAESAPAGATEYHFHLTGPVGASDLEHLLWQARRHLETRGAGAQPLRDSEKTG
jgi:hypothetical protein